MPVSRTKLQSVLKYPYDRQLFIKEVLVPVFGSSFKFYTTPLTPATKPNNTELTVINKVGIYGSVQLDDDMEVICYEIVIRPNIKIEQNRVAVQRYIRKLLSPGQAALINFVSPANKNLWRLTLVAKDSVLTDEGIEEKTTNAKRYTYLLGPSESCKTAAERLEILSVEKEINLDNLKNAFSVEKLSKAFFDEYKTHYNKFVDYLNNSNFKKYVFEGNEKDIRDFIKKLLGRIVFLYFVQKKGWLGASNDEYKDGRINFVTELFDTSGGNDNFYPLWLKKLFFETLNLERKSNEFQLPDGKIVKVPFLNGGLFDIEEYDEGLFTFPPYLFRNSENEDNEKCRGFLDFLNSYNFTVYEDSPDDHIVAVDPEMLGHIFENLLEDNKDKGAYYTPKEIVHYMCQESLIEYLTTHLSKKYKVYISFGENQYEIFGNESKRGQLKFQEEFGENGLDKKSVEKIVKEKDISNLKKEQLNHINKLLDSVKICDPAIGSGAFPMGLLQEIFSIKEVIAFELHTEWNPAFVKLNIIQNSIYGVDIEKGAVDIARLRFWLSLVVDEENPKPLPNLDFKIVVGDSLLSKFNDEIVEIDWDVDTLKGGFFKQEFIQKNIDLLKQITEKQKKYFVSFCKSNLKFEIRNLKIDLLINQFEMMIKIKGLKKPPSSKSDKYKEQTERYLETLGWKNTIKKLKLLKDNPNLHFYHFDWKLDFPEVLNPYLLFYENIGFDIIIGNPPYVSAVTMARSDRLKKIFKIKYPEASGSYDLYILFLLLNKDICCKDGYYSWIIPNKFLIANYANKTKNLLINSFGLYQSINVSKFNVFEGLGVYPIIIQGNNSKKSIFQEYMLENYHDLLLRRFVKPVELINYKTLKEFGIKTYSGTTGFQAMQITNNISEIKTNNSIPFIVSGCVDKYVWRNNNVKYMGSFYNSAYINNLNKIISDSKWNFWLSPKIIIAGMTKVIEAVFSNVPIGLGVGIYGIYNFGSFDPYSLTAILNSKYLSYYFQNKFKDKHLAGGYLAINKTTIENLPALKIKPEFNLILKNISKYIHFLKYYDISNRFIEISLYFENLIDAIVYEIYLFDLLKINNVTVIENIHGLVEIDKSNPDTKTFDVIKNVFTKLYSSDSLNHNKAKLYMLNEISIIENKVKNYC